MAANIIEYFLLYSTKGVWFDFQEGLGNGIIYYMNIVSEKFKACNFFKG